MNITKEWKNLHEARTIMKRMRREMKELDKLMVIAQQEICQPKYT
jgi:hypothetical protein